MKKTTRYVLTAGLWWLCSFAVAQAQSAPPEDEGKALLERTCTKCHELAGTLSQRNSRERWSAIVDDMIARGAEASDAEIDRLVDYLARNLGNKVNVNKATAEELAGALELPKAIASAIVEYREKNGNFKSLEDLRKVPAIDWKTIESKKDRLDFAQSK
jgi:competence protein ComEA